MVVKSEGVSPNFSLIEFGDIKAVLAGARCGLSPSPPAGASWDQWQRFSMALHEHGVPPLRRRTMRQVTLGCVGICHAMRKKRNLLSYADFLLVRDRKILSNYFL
jgi:hypothetical protein